MAAAVYEINGRGKLPSESGVIALLRGEEAAKEFEDLVTFDSLRSLSKRGARSMLNLLLKRGYLDRHYDVEGDTFYLFLTEEGEEIAKAYLTKPRKSATSKKSRAPLFIDKESIL